MLFALFRLLILKLPSYFVLVNFTSIESAGLITLTTAFCKGLFSLVSTTDPDIFICWEKAWAQVSSAITRQSFGIEKVQKMNIIRLK
jgi:uncharacterized membrane protein